MDNKKEQAELKATNIISLFFFFRKKGRASFRLLKKVGRPQKRAGRRALQKRPRQNTELNIYIVSNTALHIDRFKVRYISDYSCVVSV